MIPANLPSANLTQGTARIAPADGIDGKWLLEALRTRAVQEEAKVRAVGTTFLTLNIGEIRKLSVPVPQDADLRALGQAVATRAERVRSLQSECATQIQLLQERRQALITAAVTGGLEAVGRVA